MLIFRFYDGERGTVYTNRVYTRRDAALVYDALRKKYPEHGNLRLEVWVLEHLSHWESRAIAAKRVDQEKVITDGVFVERVDWLGPRPRIEGPGRIVEMKGEGTNADKVAEVLSVFSGGEAWRPSAMTDIIG